MLRFLLYLAIKKRLISLKKEKTGKNKINTKKKVVKKKAKKK